jgi:hypothetical protein
MDRVFFEVRDGRLLREVIARLLIELERRPVADETADCHADETVLERPSES